MGETSLALAAAASHSPVVDRFIVSLQFLSATKPDWGYFCKSALKTTADFNLKILLEL